MSRTSRSTGRSKELQWSSVASAAVRFLQSRCTPKQALVIGKREREGKKESVVSVEQKKLMRKSPLHSPRTGKLCCVTSETRVGSLSRSGQTSWGNTPLKNLAAAAHRVTRWGKKWEMFRLVSSQADTENSKHTHTHTHARTLTICQNLLCRCCRSCCFFCFRCC